MVQTKSKSSIQTMESLISVSAKGDNFYALVSNLQGLYSFLQHNSSSRCEDNYLRLLTHLLENYLDERTKSYFRQRISQMIANHTESSSAADYFRQRFARANFLDLLKHHRKLTGKWLVLTSVDYTDQKFKIKQF